MIITTRNDASTAIGIWHVMRCHTLAGVLRDKGASVSLSAVNMEGYLCNHIEDRSNCPPFE